MTNHDDMHFPALVWAVIFTILLVAAVAIFTVVGRVLLGGEQDEGVGPHRLLEREDRLLASDEEGRDHVRKYDDVAQRQHRIGPGLTRNEWWSRLRAGHGSKSFYCPSPPRPAACAQPRQTVGLGRDYGPQRQPRPKGRYDTPSLFSKLHSPEKT